jgi:hypothetical protein
MSLQALKNNPVLYFNFKAFENDENHFLNKIVSCYNKKKDFSKLINKPS